jgi:hypothetical protein
MDTIVVLLIVAVAAAFIARRVWRTVQSARAANAGCATCGCSEEREPLSL